MRLIGTIVAALGLGILLPAQSQAQTSKLSVLFDQLNVKEIREPGVSIKGWVEITDQGSMVRVSVSPESGARLVADPGIQVAPIEERLGVWLDTAEISHFIEGQSYFASPQIVDVGLIAGDGQPISANVKFAYCLADDICLFGEERISIETATVN